MDRTATIIIIVAIAGVAGIYLYKRWKDKQSQPKIQPMGVPSTSSLINSNGGPVISDLDPSLEKAYMDWHGGNTI